MAKFTSVNATLERLNYHNEGREESVIDGYHDVLVEALDDLNDLLKVGDAEQRI